jgi:hypothetical protein
MRNIISLYKDDDGNILCRYITQKGKEYVEECIKTNKLADYWGEEAVITIDEIDELLDKEL